MRETKRQTVKTLDVGYSLHIRMTELLAKPTKIHLKF